MKERIKEELVLASLTKAIQGTVIGVLLCDEILRKLIGKTEEISQTVLKGWQQFENAIKIIPILKITQSRESQLGMDWEEKERLERLNDGGRESLKRSLE